MDNNDIFEENIRISFSKVKEDMQRIKEEINGKNEEISSVKGKIEEINNKIENILLLLEKEDKKEPKNLFLFSTGNEGVINDQRSTINNDQQQFPTRNNAPEGSSVDILLLHKVQSLTDREFSVFLAILELQRVQEEVTYGVLAQKLRISEPTIRGVVNALLSKKIPILKERFFNKKATLTSSPELLNLGFFQKILSLRQQPTQKTLLDPI